MQGEKYQQFMSLCEQAAVEQEPKKILELAKEILRLLDEKKGRLQDLTAASANNPKPQ